METISAFKKIIFVSSMAALVMIASAFHLQVQAAEDSDTESYAFDRVKMAFDEEPSVLQAGSDTDISQMQPSKVHADSTEKPSEQQLLSAGAQ